MEKKDQSTLAQIHYLGQKTEDQLLLKQISKINLKKTLEHMFLGSFFCHFYNHKLNIDEIYN